MSINELKDGETVRDIIRGQRVHYEFKHLTSEEFEAAKQGLDALLDAAFTEYEKERLIIGSNKLAIIKHNFSAHILFIVDRLLDIKKQWN